MVLLHVLTVDVHDAKVVLGRDITLSSGGLIGLEGLRQLMCCVLCGGGQQIEMALSRDVALCSGQAIPMGSHLQVLYNTLTVRVQHTQVMLSPSIALRCR